MPEIYKEFGKNIRKYRKEKKISTPDFAKRVGVSTGLVNDKNIVDLMYLNLRYSLIWLKS